MPAVDKLLLEEALQDSPQVARPAGEMPAPEMVSRGGDTAGERSGSGAPARRGDARREAGERVGGIPVASGEGFGVLMVACQGNIGYGYGWGIWGRGRVRGGRGTAPFLLAPLRLSPPVALSSCCPIPGCFGFRVCPEVLSCVWGGEVAWLVTLAPFMRGKRAVALCVTWPQHEQQK